MPACVHACNSAYVSAHLRVAVCSCELSRVRVCACVRACVRF